MSGDFAVGARKERELNPIGGGWWTPEQAAAALGCTADHVRDLLRSGKLSGKRERRRWWVEPASVARYLGRRTEVKHG